MTVVALISPIYLYFCLDQKYLNRVRQDFLSSNSSSNFKVMIFNYLRIVNIMSFSLPFVTVYTMEFIRPQNRWSLASSNLPFTLNCDTISWADYFSGGQRFLFYVCRYEHNVLPLKYY